MAPSKVAKASDASPAEPAQGPNTAQQQVNVVSEMPAIDFTQMLPYEVFDNTEYEQRTVREWLDLRSDINDSNGPRKSSTSSSEKLAAESLSFGVYLAKIPIPAKALEGSIWRNCLVTAYSAEKDLWKVTWKKSNGWQLEHNLDEEDEDVSDKGSDSEEEDNLDSRNREAWISRYASICAFESVQTCTYWIIESIFSFWLRIPSTLPRDLPSRIDAVNRQSESWYQFAN